jgi:hypothetical protein
LGITGLKTNKIHLPREVITLAAAVDTIQTKDIAAGLIVLKFHRSICHKSAKIISHHVSLTKKYSVILIYFRPMADDRWQSETLLYCMVIISLVKETGVYKENHKSLTNLPHQVVSRAPLHSDCKIVISFV